MTRLFDRAGLVGPGIGRVRVGSGDVPVGSVGSGSGPARVPVGGSGVGEAVLAADTERASLLDDERRLSKHIDAHPDDTEANKELAQVGLCEMCNVL